MTIDACEPTFAAKFLGGSTSFGGDLPVSGKLGKFGCMEHLAGAFPDLTRFSSVH